MSFIFGMIIGVLLFFCIISEIIGAFRPIFSCLFLLGVMGALAFVYFVGMLLSPLFLLGVILSIVIFLPIGLSKGDK